MSEEYDRYRQDKAVVGLEFQDYVAELFHEKLGLVLSNYTSRRYQVLKGENRQGIEIKKDCQFRNTKNLWIEIAEKDGDDETKEHVPSGIYRNDNAWLWAMGDEHIIWLMAKRHLVLHYERRQKGKNPYELRENGKKTSIGFLLPTAAADQLAVLKLDRHP